MAIDVDAREQADDEARHCRDHERTEKSLLEHGLILQALQNRDADEAILRLREHIGTVKADLLKNGKPASS